MARQSKKILKKLQPKAKPSEAEKKPEKVGKDYLLIVILSLTIVFMIIGWSNFDYFNRGLYLALIISLSTTYARRHYKLTETQDLWAERLGYVSMGLAVVFFAVVIYFRFIS